MLILKIEDFCSFTQLADSVLSEGVLEQLSDADLCGVMFWGKKYKTESASMNYERARNEFILRGNAV